MTRLSVRPLLAVRDPLRSRMAPLLAAAIAICVLAACGASTGARPQGAAATPSPSAAPSPTASPTPRPTATPRPVPTVTPPPPILDVRPSSMSIVGHLDCTTTTFYTCQAAVLAEAGNQTSLQWTSSTTVPGQITFSPASGVLAPNQMTLVTIAVPLTDCTPGLFVFHGPANTHTISWAC